MGLSGSAVDKVSIGARVCDPQHCDPAKTGRIAPKAALRGTACCGSQTGHRPALRLCPLPCPLTGERAGVNSGNTYSVAPLGPSQAAANSGSPLPEGLEGGLEEFALSGTGPAVAAETALALSFSWRLVWSRRALSRTGST